MARRAITRPNVVAAAQAAAAPLGPIVLGDGAVVTDTVLHRAPVSFVHPLDRVPKPGSIRVMCSEPGLELVGLVHPARAEYPPGRFDYRELAAMMAHPALSVIALHGEPVVRVPSVFEAFRDALIVRPGGTP